MAKKYTCKFMCTLICMEVKFIQCTFTLILLNGNVHMSKILLWRERQEKLQIILVTSLFMQQILLYQTCHLFTHKINVSLLAFLQWNCHNWTSFPRKPSKTTELNCAFTIDINFYMYASTAYSFYTYCWITM